MTKVMEKYSDMPDELDLLSRTVVDCFFNVHKNIGPGYLEQIYEDCLCIEFEDRSIRFQRQCPVRLVYNNKPVPTAFRFDLVVEDKILIELKAVEKLHPVHEAQMYSYLQMSELPLGFLVNFNVPLIKDGIRRYVPKNLRAFGPSRLKGDVVNAD